MLQQLPEHVTEIHWVSGIGCINSPSFIVCHLDRMRKKKWFESRHDKTNKMSVRPAKTQISLGIRPVWSESSLSAWRNIGTSATHWADAQAVLNLRWAHTHFVGFVVSWLKFCLISLLSSTCFFTKRSFDIHKFYLWNIDAIECICILLKEFKDEMGLPDTCIYFTFSKV